MNADFSPKLPGRHAVPVRIAFLVSSRRTLQEQSASSVATISAAVQPGQGYYTALFTNEAAAYQWLGH